MGGHTKREPLLWLVLVSRCRHVAVSVNPSPAISLLQAFTEAIVGHSPSHTACVLCYDVCAEL
jgi:hypothetical protein